MQGPTVLLALVLGTTACSAAAPKQPTVAPPAPPVVETGSIAGVVADISQEPLPNALVILQTTGAPTRETTTNAAGQFVIPQVPAGTYTVQVLYGENDVSKVVVHDGTTPFRLRFSIDPTATRLQCFSGMTMRPLDRSLFDDDGASRLLHEPRVIRGL